jgi:hypothetical protein
MAVGIKRLGCQPLTISASLRGINMQQSWFAGWIFLGRILLTMIIPELFHETYRASVGEEAGQSSLMWVVMIIDRIMHKRHETF